MQDVVYERPPPLLGLAVLSHDPVCEQLVDGAVLTFQVDLHVVQSIDRNDLDVRELVAHFLGVIRGAWDAEPERAHRLHARPVRKCRRQVVRL